MESLLAFTGIVTKDPGEADYASLCPELEVASQGKTVAEARAMLLEAVTGYLEGCFEDNVPYLRPTPAADDPRNEDPGSVVDVFRFRVDVAVNVHA